MDDAAALEGAAPAGGGAPRGSSAPVWRFLFKPRWLGWHLLMVVSFWGMLWLGDWQLHRALGGNALSWAYTFEWPLFACFAVVFWAKTIRDEFRIKRGQMPGATGSLATMDADGIDAALDGLPVSIRIAQAAAAAPAEDEDPELSAYNAYLARLNDEVKRHGKWHGWRS